MFANIVIDADERGHVVELGLPVVREGDDLFATEPCPAFRNGCCSLYEIGRPHTCEGYECVLLASLAAGDMRRDECTSVIQLVRSLAHDTELAMGLRRGGFTRAAARSYIAEHDPGRDPIANADFVVPFARLAVLGTKYFGYPVDEAERPTVAAGESTVGSPPGT
jgi:hypothetical protein